MNSGKIIGIYFLFIDDRNWNTNHFLRYNKVIPRFHAMQLSAAVGINRILALTNLIDIPLTTETSTDDDLHISHRQVMNVRRLVQCRMISFRNIYFAMLDISVRRFENISISMKHSHRWSERKSSNVFTKIVCFFVID